MIQSHRKAGAATARFAASRSGNFATMAALVAPLVIVIGAVAVDSASLYYERRDAQGLTDLAAITAAAHISKADDAALAALTDNGIKRITLTHGSISKEVGIGETAAPVLLSVIEGRYVANAAVAVAERFKAGAAPFNAVKVTVQKPGTQFFSRSLISAPTIVTTAIANAPAEAAFSIGSRLASLNGGLVNALLGGLTGTTLSLSVMDYEALIKTDVSAFSFMDALALQLGLTGVSYSDVLKSDVTIGQIASAIADISGVDRTASLAAKTFARDSAASRTKIRLDRMFDLGSAANLPIGHPPSGLGATVDAFDLITAGAQLANGTNQVKLNLGATIPGLLSVTVDVAVGEPPQQSPWFAIGETGDLVRTAQTRLKLIAEVGGPGGLLGTSIKLPVYVEVAFAEAKLTDIDCTGNKRVAIAARPGVVELRIAETGALSDFSVDPSFAPAKIVTAPLVTITGSADIQMSNLAATPLSFSGSEIEKRTVKSVSTKNFTQSLTKSLLEDLKLDVKIGGLGLGLPSVLGQTVSGILATVTPAVDQLLYGVLETLGVKIGEADVRVTGISCGRSVLVQ